MDATLCSKRDFTNMITSNTLSGEIILGYPSGPDIITRVIREKAACEDRNRERNVKRLCCLAWSIKEGPRGKE